MIQDALSTRLAHKALWNSFESPQGVVGPRKSVCEGARLRCWRGEKRSDVLGADVCRLLPARALLGSKLEVSAQRGIVHALQEFPGLIAPGQRWSVFLASAAELARIGCRYHLLHGPMGMPGHEFRSGLLDDRRGNHRMASFLRVAEDCHPSHIAHEIRHSLHALFGFLGPGGRLLGDHFHCRLVGAQADQQVAVREA